MNDELPEGWARTTLAEIAVVNPRHPRDLDNTLMVTFVPMPLVSESDWKLKATQERPLQEVRTGYTQFADGDVLFAKITPCMENGKAAVATNLRNGLGCGTTELHVLRPHLGIDATYLYHFIHQESFRREAANNFTGTAGQLRVPVDFIRTAEIPLPPSAEQRRVVAQVETILAKARSSQERLEKIPAIIKRFRQAVLAAACNGQLTADWRSEQRSRGVNDKVSGEDGPSGWRPVCVSDVIEDLKYGTAQKCSYEKRGAPVLRIPNVANGSIDHTDLKYAVLPPRELESLRLVPGDILIIRSNGSVSLVGRPALVRMQEAGFAYAGYLIRIRPRRTVIEPGFLNLVLGSQDVRVQIELEARSTSGVNNINSEEVRALEFLLPPLDEQNEIIRRVDAMFKLAGRLQARYEKASAQVARLTQSVLARAFRGELVPTEAELSRREGREYETAAQLLERITAARESTRQPRPGPSERPRAARRRRGTPTHA